MPNPKQTVRLSSQCLRSINLLDFNEWFRALKLVVRTEKLQDVFETALPPAPAAGADAQALADWAVVFHCDNEMVTELQKMYGKPPSVELQELVNMFRSSFVQNYNMQSMEKKISEVHSLLIEFKKSIKRNKQPIVGASSTPQVMAIQGGRVQKYKPQGKAKGKGKCKGPQNSYPTKPKKPQPYKKGRPAKDGQCHHYKEEGHWKRNCPVYLAVLIKKKKKSEGQNVASISSGADAQALADWVVLFHCHNEVTCLMLRTIHVSKKGASYFITFTDDYSHYGYVYLLKHKHEVFETFNVFKSEVENQLEKTIKAIRSDHGGEYISQEFKDYIKACGIVQQLTPPYTPQHNGVSERRNRTLLNIVRSMMSLATLPLSFWDYTLESVARILNMVPTKKVDKTPYELWHGKVSNVSYLKETMGYYFYYPSENNIVVERYADFLKKDFILQKESVRIVELEDEDILPSENTSEHPIEEESLALIVSQEEDVIPIRTSVRTHKAPDGLCLNVKIDPDRLCFNVKVEEHSLIDLNEPANYKAALSDPEFEKWLVAMSTEMQSIKSPCATTFAEMKRMHNVPYASAVGSIMYDVSSKQSTTAQHATEAEYIAASEAAKEAVWIRKFIDELGIVPSNDYPIKMNCDNSAAIIMAKESGIQKGAIHFKRKYHYVRDCIETGKIDIVKVHTDDNLADPFTKALVDPKLTRHARSIGLRPASSFT
nr:retrotransposon protein, putative, Ty1-copia subclass [Tanacetum cinerariifolium]